MVPLLSIVATARNDNHGGDLLRRMQIFVNGLLAQSEKYQLPVELILVEWNPPVDKPKLAQVLSWPREHHFCTVRIVEVPPEIHARYRHAANLPLYQMIAKNVGIRRARGEFILVTNIDIIFSDELFAYFTSGRLEKGNIYRVDRYDIKQNIPFDATIEEQLKYCSNNVIRINNKQGTLDPISNEYTVISQIEDAKQRPLHNNACGDFQLMHKEDWYTLCGYSELDIFSFHLDSILEYSAFCSGLNEVELIDPIRIYHIEHSIGSGWTPEGNKVLDNRLKSSNILRLANHEFVTLTYKMELEQKAYLFNDENWGLALESLPETVILQTNWDANIPAVLNNIKSKFKLRVDERYSSFHRNIEAFREWLKEISLDLFKYVIKDTAIDIKEQLKGVQRDNLKKVIIFGLGEACREFVLPLLKILQIEPDYIIDNNKENWNSEFQGIKVQPVETVLKEDKENIFIIITSFTYYHKMKAQLELMGFRKNQNFYCMIQRHVLAVKNHWYLLKDDITSDDQDLI